MTTKEKVKANANGTAPATEIVLKPVITMRDYENWTSAFQELNGHTAIGQAPIAGATVRAMVRAGWLVKPGWATDEDVDNAPAKQVMDIYILFDKWFEANVEIPKA